VGYCVPNDQGARGPNIDGTQMLQCYGELGRSEGPVAPDINPSQKNCERHSISPQADRLSRYILLPRRNVRFLVVKSVA
jgi:hypothetical protein